MTRYKIFQKNLINYNLIAQYNYQNSLTLPKLINIRVNYKNKQLMKNSSVLLEYFYLIESFSNKTHYCIKPKNTKIPNQQNKITGFGVDIQQKHMLNFLEFLVVFIFPAQNQIPKIILTKNKNRFVIATFNIQSLSYVPIVTEIVNFKPSIIEIIIKIRSNSVEEAKTFLNQFNIPFINLINK